MDKMFKRTLLGAAVAMASTGAFADGAAQVGINSDFAVQAYGVAAISIAMNLDETSQYAYDNESRIGFRASKDMMENVNVFMQIESGWAEPSWVAQGSGATLGNRDTFLGLQGDWGKVRFGRMLTPMYEIIDWPYSNPGLGGVFDGGADVKFHYDRKSQMARYDSPAFGGFTFNAAIGRGTELANEDSQFTGLAAHYALDGIATFHVGYESATDFQHWSTGAAKGDTNGFIVGFEAPLPAGFGIAAAYKYGENKDKATGVKASQGSYSIVGQYWNGPLGVKVGYAANQDAEVGGATATNTADDVVSVQVMGVINGFVPYVRLSSQTSDNKDSVEVLRVGLEYGF
ncbi:porin [Vibrio vulnificus]|nr:porin [Vibrio vulnificus]